MRSSLRPLLERDRCTIVPGAGDPLSALLAEQAGFEAVYMSGYYVCATMGMLAAGLVPATSTREQFGKIMEDDAKRWVNVIRTAGIRAE